MTILHYYMDYKTYVEISDKFIGVIELFNTLIKNTPITKDLEVIMTKSIDDIKSDLANYKKKVCVNDGCEKTVSGRIDFLTITIGTTKINMTSKISSNDEGFEDISKTIVDIFNLAIKSYNLDTFTQIVPVSMDELHGTVKINDLMAIDVSIHIPTPGMDEETDENYYTTLWIEFNLDLYNDSALVSTSI